jgi:hypothetical protein
MINFPLLHTENIYTYIWLARSSGSSVISINNLQYLISMNKYDHTFRLPFQQYLGWTRYMQTLWEVIEGTDVTSLIDMTNSNTLAIFLSTMVSPYSNLKSTHISIP